MSAPKGVAVGLGQEVWMVVGRSCTLSSPPARPTRTQEATRGLTCTGTKVKVP